jgi:hypothetical protein
MKKTVLTAAFAFALFAAGLHAEEAVTGKWNATADAGPQGPMELAFDLKAGAAGAVTGTMAITAMGMELPISDGKIKGKDVSFKVVIAGTPNGDMVIGYTGKLDGDTMTIATKIDGAPDQPPPMVAKRAAAAPAKK